MKKQYQYVLFTLKNGISYSGILRVEIILSIVLFMSMIILFRHLANETLIEKEITSFDLSVTTTIQSLRSPFLTPLMFFISFLGADFIIIVSVIISSMLWLRHKKNASFLFSITILISMMSNIFLKDFFQRPRPPLHSLISLSTYSFPSGHAMNSCVFYLLLAYLVYEKTRKIPLTFFISSMLSILILLIGVSRIYLGVHYPSDIIAGYIAGIGLLSLIVLLQKSRVLFTSGQAT